MIPTVAYRGKLVLWSALWLAAIGALYSSPPLIALGTIVLIGLFGAYIAFYPTAIMLRRRKVELSWWVRRGKTDHGALVCDAPFSLCMKLRNHGFTRLHVESIDVVGGRALDIETPGPADVPHRTELSLEASVRCRQSGYHVLHGARVSMADTFGLFSVTAYFPNPISFKVFPRRQSAVELRRLSQLKRVSPHDSAGQQLSKRRGQSGELRELRDHRQGDPFKLIAWKATARRQRLMVREHESEFIAAHWFLVDIGASMRDGRAGRTALDHAIELTADMARNAAADGGYVGLVTFDRDIHDVVGLGAGVHHVLGLIDRLIESNHVVSADTTDVTTGELVAAVSRYLARQQAIDVSVRIVPSLDHEMWLHLQAGPHGELYDLEILDRVVRTSIEQTMSSKHHVTPPRWRLSNSPESARLTRLRVFCRLYGIELPYRATRDPRRRAHGLSAAVEHATSKRCDRLTIVSDLADLVTGTELVTSRSLRRARRGGRSVRVWLPSTPSYGTGPLEEEQSTIVELVARRRRQRAATATKMLARTGTRVAFAPPPSWQARQPPA